MFLILAALVLLVVVAPLALVLGAAFAVLWLAVFVLGFTWKAVKAARRHHTRRALNP